MAFGSISVDRIVDSEGSVFSPSSVSFRNRIINGDMRIDQRNAGASVSVSTDTGTLDRWRGDSNSGGGVFSVQQSSTVPANFVNSAIITVTTADASIGATEAYAFAQRIEGLNISDLGWGTANAKTVTLSFQVRSSVTGTFGGALQNSDNTRSYPFSYTINSANTWETKSITIAGDTSGTWLTTNGIGIRCVFSIGSGSSRKGTANAWAGADYRAPTGAVDLISTLNATWYITGVQLEVGSVATPFERRPYGTELSLCQRYYQLIDGFTSSGNAGGTTVSCVVTFPVTMRASPSVATSAALVVTDPGVADFTQSSGNASIVAGRVSAGGIQVALANFSGITQRYAFQHNVGSNSITLSAEL